jgi:Subtilase family/Fervidolysin N-terminal prodomain/PASTA domain
MGRGVLGGLGVIVLVVGVAAAAATGQSNTVGLGSETFEPGEVIVRFKPGLGTKMRSAALRAENATLGEPLLLPGTALVELPAGESVPAAVRDFEQRPEVLSAQPNFVYHAEATPTDPFYGYQWGLNQASDADIDAPEAWDLTTGSSTARVAIVDTGVEYDHPDLVGNIAVLGPDYYSGDGDPRDENGHGTHVAGTIGANGNNGVGVAGVSWRVGLMPIRVLGPTGSGTTASITNGFTYAAQHGARIINASLGGRNYDPLMAAVIAGASETLFVVAAGNGGGDGIGDDNELGSGTYPCNYAPANLLCVAATDLDDSLAAFSNYGGTSVDLAAPGVGILSTYPAGTQISLNGTSMASPHVAGTAALLLARNPGATVAQLRVALLGSVDVLAPLQTKVVTSGRLNAHKALLTLAPPAPPPPPLAQPRRPAERPCVVPRVTGKTVRRARVVLIARSCALGKVTRVYSRKVRKGRVLSQSRRPGARVPRTTRVHVVVSRGRRR